MQAIYLINTRHLGDTICTFNLLYSRRVETNETFQVFGPRYVPLLLELFDYNGFSYGGKSPEDMEEKHGLHDLLPTIPDGYFQRVTASAPFIALNLFTAPNLPRYHPKQITLPKLKVKGEDKQDMVCFQFDSRSLNKWKYALTSEQEESLLTRFKGDARIVTGIGGHETKPYLPYEFRLGNLRHLLMNLLNCKKFIGVDSGMSHLAGTAGVDSDILCIHFSKAHVDDLIALYNMMYPSIRMHRRYQEDARIKLL